MDINFSEVENAEELTENNLQEFFKNNELFPMEVQYSLKNLKKGDLIKATTYSLIWEKGDFGRIVNCVYDRDDNLGIGGRLRRIGKCIDKDGSVIERVISSDEFQPLRPMLRNDNLGITPNKSDGTLTEEGFRKSHLYGTFDQNKDIEIDLRITETICSRRSFLTSKYLKGSPYNDVRFDQILFDTRKMIRCKGLYFIPLTTRYYFQNGTQGYVSVQEYPLDRELGIVIDEDEYSKIKWLENDFGYRLKERSKDLGVYNLKVKYYFDELDMNFSLFSSMAK